MKHGRTFLFLLLSIAAGAASADKPIDLIGANRKAEGGMGDGAFRGTSAVRLDGPATGELDLSLAARRLALADPGTLNRVRGSRERSIYTKASPAVVMVV